MFNQLLEWLQFNFWQTLLSLVAGLTVTAPLMLIPALRKRILDSDIDIEAVGFLTLIVLIVAVGCYNLIGVQSGA